MTQIKLSIVRECLLNLCNDTKYMFALLSIIMPTLLEM